MKIAFLYAGQGSQKVGMGKDFYENCKEYRELIDSLEKTIDVTKLMHEGPMEELTKTENTQRCMAAFAAGVTTALAAKGITPDVACGLSLGEYGALYAAGVFDAEEYVKLTTFRGRVMSEAAEGKDCCMSAILGLDSKSIKEVCDEYQGGYVTVANYNCPGQTVICGDTSCVEEVEAKLKEAGAKRCIRLQVSGPFHTKYMEPAGEALKEYFKAMNFQTPKLPVLLNVTGTYYREGDDLKENLIRQVSNSVRLEDQLKQLIEDNVDLFVEIGPGNAITGFLKKTSKQLGKSIEVMNIDTYEDLLKVESRVLG